MYESCNKVRRREILRKLRGILCQDVTEMFCHLQLTGTLLKQIEVWVEPTPEGSVSVGLDLVSGYSSIW